MKKVIVVVFLLLLVVGCNQNKTDVDQSIESIVKDTSKNEINVNSLTNIIWDKAFLFTPYSTTESIQEQLGSKFKDKSNIGMRDDIYLLVILYESEVIKYVEIKRQGYDFSIGEKGYLTPHDDVISIIRH